MLYVWGGSIILWMKLSITFLQYTYKLFIKMWDIFTGLIPLQRECDISLFFFSGFNPKYQMKWNFVRVPQ